MADFIKGLFGGAAAPSNTPAADDFNDFSNAPTKAFDTGPSATLLASPPAINPLAYTKWYEVWKRHGIDEFKTEGFVLVIMVVFAILHIRGSRINRQKAAQWAKHHGPQLREQFAYVGYGAKAPTAADAEGAGLARTLDSQSAGEMMKERSLVTFQSYATGRQNVAFVDVEINLLRRYNPLILAIEAIGAFFVESIQAPVENVSCSLYPFDGKEKQTVPGLLPSSEELIKREKSSYDNFVWAVVNKDKMKRLRDDRYDLSITTTKDNAKLPEWATVMSESAEITDIMLTPELCAAVAKAGEGFEYLIVTDQPIDRPTELNECAPKKRIFISMNLPANDQEYANAKPIFDYFLNLSDFLVQKAHFRPEITKKIRMPREALITRLQKDSEAEKIEERNRELEKLKKQKRDAELRALDEKGQKKFLQKEKEKEYKKSMKKQTMRA